MKRQTFYALALGAGIGCMSIFAPVENAFPAMSNIAYANKSLTLQEKMKKLLDLWLIEPIEDLIDTREDDYGAGISRGDETETHLIIFPGSAATLLPDSEVFFSWNRPGQYDYVIYDAQEKIVYKKYIDYKPKDISLIPAKLSPPLQENKKYTWALINRNTGTEAKSGFAILDKECEETITASLREMETINEPKKANLLRQAAFLQKISDEYPQEFDFYWLSRQILSAPEMDNRSLEKQYKKQKKVLLLRCEEHEQQQSKR